MTVIIKAGLIGLAVINLPEDCRDLSSAYKQLFKAELPKYDYKNCQVPFSFFKGTVLQPIVNKMGKVGAKLYDYDKTLDGTKLGKFLKKIFKVQINELDGELTGRKEPRVILGEF